MHTLIALLALSLLASTPSIAYDQNYVGETRTIKAENNDTLTYLARDYNLGYMELISANPGIDPWLPGNGTAIRLPLKNLLPDAKREGIVINLAEMRMYVYMGKDLRPVTFPIGIGRDGLETPIGETTIRYKTTGPTWRPTARMRKEDPSLPKSIGPGINNPLGTHALYLGWPEYLIHGTNRPFGIGRRVSSGCMRMYPESIKHLYRLIDPGTKVSIIEQPIKAQWIGNKLYIETHHTAKQAIEMEEKNKFSHEELSSIEIEYIKEKAGQFANQLDWKKIDHIVRKRSGMPINIFTKPKQVDRKTIEAEENT